MPRAQNPERVRNGFQVPAPPACLAPRAPCLMHPILCQLGPLTIYTYGFSLVVGCSVAAWLAVRSARRLPSELAAIGPEQVVDFICAALLGGMLGGRALYVALHWEWFARSPWEMPAIWHGGLVWYGGFLGGLAGGWWYAKAKRLALMRVLDQMIPFLALGHAIGRVGCFLNGCCYGRPTGAWYGVVFTGQTVPILPTQLLEAIGLVALFLWLKRLQCPSVLSRAGGLFGCYLIGYGALRFLLEFLRGDQAVWLVGLTLQQLISLVMLFAGGLLLCRRAALQLRLRS